MKRTTPNWTPADVWTLYDLIDAGYSYAAIGRKLGRTTTAVTIKSKRLRHRLMHAKSALSARQIKDILGLACSKTVTRWITTYGLKARNGGTKERPLWRVQVDDLAAWLDDPRQWPSRPCNSGSRRDFSPPPATATGGYARATWTGLSFPATAPGRAS